MARDSGLLDEQRAALEAAMDGIAILSSDGCCLYANPAHATLHGYDRPEDIVDAHWHTLYAPGEADRIERDAMARLALDGHWTGTAIGLRRDGQAFAQQLSLTQLEQGGFVCVVRELADDGPAANPSDQPVDRKAALRHAVRAFAHEIGNPLTTAVISIELTRAQLEEWIQKDELPPEWVAALQELERHQQAARESLADVMLVAKAFGRLAEDDGARAP